MFWTSLQSSRVGAAFRLGLYFHSAHWLSVHWLFILVSVSFLVSVDTEVHAIMIW